MELLRYTTKTEITNYYPVPRSLLSRNLPVTALLIYGILLDRATLSRKNGYCNDGGWIFVLYTQQELAELLGISPRMVGRYIRNLKDAGLLCPVRKTRKAANQYYLLLPVDAVSGTGTGQKCHADRTDLSVQTGQKCLPSNRNKQQDISNPYQHSEEESL